METAATWLNSLLAAYSFTPLNSVQYSINTIAESEEPNVSAKRVRQNSPA